MRIALLSLPLATFIALAACATVPAAAGQTGLNHAQRVGRYRVTPLQVEEDSRCPMNARCIWAGRVVVRVAIRDGGMRLIRKLVLGEPAPPGIVLDSVTPERMAGSAPQQPHAYRFHFSLIS